MVINDDTILNKDSTLNDDTTDVVIIGCMVAVELAFHASVSQKVAAMPPSPPPIAPALLPRLVPIYVLYLWANPLEVRFTHTMFLPFFATIKVEIGLVLAN